MTFRFDLSSKSARRGCHVKSFKMLRHVTRKLTGITTGFIRNGAAASVPVRYSHGPVESNEEFDERYVQLLSKEDVDGWEIRKAINDIQGYDLVPEPRIINAALRACRRVNDYALAVRLMEVVKDKCGPKHAVIWPYILQEIQPTLDELGVLTPEQMGYDKPEFALQEFDL